MQPVIEQVEKGDIPKALNYCSDIAESLVGEVGNREAIWVNGEKSVIKTGIMAVVIANSEDKITEEKIEILSEYILNDEEILKGIYERIPEEDREIEFDLWKNDINLSNKELMAEYEYISKDKRNEMREDYLEKTIDNLKIYIESYLKENIFFRKYLNENIQENLREDLLYNLEDLLREFENQEIEDIDIKIEMRKNLINWKILNDLRPHPEYQNLPNVYNFISKMCAEQIDDKKMLMDTYLETLPTSSPVVQQFAPAQIAPSRTRASFFTSALATLNIFVDDYVASMINEAEIDINKFNKEKTALFMILPDEKTTFYGLCSLFVNQAYTKLCEMADAKGGRLNIRHNFILDEFGNFSAIPNFGGFLTVRWW